MQVYPYFSRGKFLTGDHRSGPPGSESTLGTWDSTTRKWIHLDKMHSACSVVLHDEPIEFEADQVDDLVSWQTSISLHHICPTFSTKGHNWTSCRLQGLVQTIDYTEGEVVSRVRDRFSSPDVGTATNHICRALWGFDALVSKQSTKRKQFLTSLCCSRFEHGKLIHVVDGRWFFIFSQGKATKKPELTVLYLAYLHRNLFVYIRKLTVTLLGTQYRRLQRAKTGHMAVFCFNGGKITDADSTQYQYVLQFAGDRVSSRYRGTITC